jgi:hypothetical protein
LRRQRPERTKQMNRHCSSVFNRLPQAVFKMLCHRKIIDSDQNMLTTCHSFLMRNRRAMALDDKESSFVAKSNGRPAVSLLKFGTYGAMYLSHFRDGPQQEIWYHLCVI